MIQNKENSNTIGAPTVTGNIFQPLSESAITEADEVKTSPVPKPEPIFVTWILLMNLLIF